jgi:uncharacterized membrane protein YhhN
MVAARPDYNVRVLPFAALTVLALAALLLAEHRGSRQGAWIAKPLASAGFLGVALAGGALGTVYGRWILAGLVLSWLGDVLLIPRAERAFRAGATSFLLGHVAYAVAFTVRGIAVPATLLAGLATLVACVVLVRWLRPNVRGSMRALVYAYVVVISAMVVLAAGAAVGSATPTIFAGALLFYVSDLAVARDRFVSNEFMNRAWGLPLYYAGQLVLASTV